MMCRSKAIYCIHDLAKMDKEAEAAVIGDLIPVEVIEVWF